MKSLTHCGPFIQLTEKSNFVLHTTINILQYTSWNISYLYNFILFFMFQSRIWNEAITQRDAKVSSFKGGNAKYKQQQQHQCLNLY